MVATTSQNPNEFSFIKRNDPFLMLQTFKFFPSALAFTRKPPAKNEQILELLRGHRCTCHLLPTLSQARPGLQCRSRCRGGAAADAGEGRGGGFQGLQEGNLRRTGGFRQDMDDCFFLMPLPPPKKNVTKDNLITVFPKHPESYQ